MDVGSGNRTSSHSASTESQVQLTTQKLQQIVNDSFWLTIEAKPLEILILPSCNIKINEQKP